MIARSTTLFALLFLGGMLTGCREAPLAPTPEPQFSANESGNGAIVEVGEYKHTFGLLEVDRNNRLVGYYRWDNSFCGAGAPAVTEFVNSTWRDVLRFEESWRTLDKTDGMWIYVYEWDGTAWIGCNWLKTHTPIATGRGSRLLHDNDFFPTGPYGPGPGANAYLLRRHGALTTPAGTPVQFNSRVHAVVAADGETMRVYDVDLRLSPDPRK